MVQTKEQIEPMYNVKLYYYSRYVHLKKLKEELIRVQKENKSSCFEPLINLESFNDICEYLEKHSIEKKFYEMFKKIVIENIIFSSTTHVYISDLNSKTSKKNIENKIELITKGFSGNLMLENIDTFYNRVDELLIDDSTDVFFPAIYEEENTIIIFSATSILPYGSNKRIIVPCMLKIDFNDNKIYSFMCNKFSNINKDDDNDIRTISLFNQKVINKLNVLGIKEKLIDDEKKEDYERKLFLECCRLNNLLIEDYKNELLQKGSNMDKSIERVIRNLSKLDGVTLGKSVKGKIRNQIESICVGEFMTQNLNAYDLRKKAKEKKMYGYPTKIRFIGDGASRGDTKSTNSGHPLPVHEIFHSLNTSFEYFESIIELRLAWFDHEIFRNNTKYAKTTSVSQTTIKITAGKIIINYYTKEKKDKEMINYILKTIQGIVEPIRK